MSPRNQLNFFFLLFSNINTGTPFKIHSNKKQEQKYAPVRQEVVDVWSKTRTTTAVNENFSYNNILFQLKNFTPKDVTWETLTRKAAFIIIVCLSMKMVLRFVKYA